jgi:hypothetical protein
MAEKSGRNRETMPGEEDFGKDNGAGILDIRAIHKQTAIIAIVSTGRTI